MKYCIECGARLPDGAKFCSECGAKQETAAEELNKPLERLKDVKERLGRLMDEAKR